MNRPLLLIDVDGMISQTTPASVQKNPLTTQCLEDELNRFVD